MRKLSSITLIMLLLLSLSAVASAQHGGDFEYCGELSEEDCDLYYSYEPVPLESAAMDLTVEGAVTVEGTTFDATIDVAGSYIYNLDEYNAFLDSIADLTLLDVSVDVMLSWFEAGIDAFDGEMSVVVTPPAMFAFMLPVDTIDLNLWLVDGVGYLDFTPIGLLAEDETLSGIYGVDALDVIRTGLGSVTLGDIFDELEDMDMDKDDFDFDFGDFSGEDFERFVPEELEDEESISQFVTFTRLDDAVIDGVGVAVYQTEVDVVALFENEFVLEQIEKNVSEEDLDGMEIDVVLEALQESLEGSFIVSTESYGLEDGILYGSTLELDLTINTVPLEELDGAEIDEEDLPEPIEVYALFDLVRSEINAVEEITVPDGATVISPEELMEMDN